MRGADKALEQRAAGLLLQGSEERGAEEAVERELDAVVRTLRRVPRLRQLLRHPRVSLEDKMAWLGRAVPLTSDVGSLARVFISRGQVACLGGVLRAYRALRASRGRTVTARVTAAARPSRNEILAVEKALARALGRKVAVSVRVNRALIGGLLIQVGERRIDGTVGGALDRLERHMAAA